MLIPNEHIADVEKHIDQLLEKFILDVQNSGHEPTNDEMGLLAGFINNSMQTPEQRAFWSFVIASMVQRLANYRWPATQN